MDPFYAAMKNKDREFWFEEEVVSRERIGMKKIRDENFSELIVAKAAYGKNRIRSLHNYDILTNPFYSDKFLYIPCVYPDRWDYTISQYADNYLKCYSSDIVRLAVDLAYMPKEESLKLEFNERYIFKRILQLRNQSTTSR